MSGLRNIAASAVALLIVVLAIGFGVGVIETMPENALVILNSNVNEYATLRCVKDNEVNHNYARITKNNMGQIVDMEPEDGIEAVPITKARRMRARPDERCQRGAGFTGEHRSLIAEWLGWRSSRWTKDGEWKW